MAEIFYDLFILLCGWGIDLASLFSSKIKRWIHGRRDLFETLIGQIGPQDKIIWFHCASLGEFEQGRPVIESIQSKLERYKILLTFFSPSGYENQKYYAHADVISYLTLDTKKNMEYFVTLTHPHILVLIKYEFWPHMISTLYRRSIPIYVISAAFRKDQIFFRSYGGMMRKILKKISHFFVQNDISQELLRSIGISDSTVCGDTRFDRVVEIRKTWSFLPMIEKFKNNTLTFVAGSTWERDEDLLIDLINRCTHPIKFILVPHEICPAHISRLQQRIFKKTLRQSEYTKNEIKNGEVLIVNVIGLLTRIYGSADIAYVGGGFGKEGIHNVLEPAVFGIPVLFGPIHDKFPEAQGLLDAKASHVIENLQELEYILDQLTNDSVLRIQMGTAAARYVQRNVGATAIITTALKKALQSQIKS
ncbi:MAG: glycosyltransferase N-terminal domain-containing protein [Flavobacteriales bacterium]